MRTLIASAMVLIGASVALAQLEAPQGPPPVLKVIAALDKAKGVLVFRDISCKSMPVEKEIVVMENGQAVKKKVVEYVNVVEERMVSINVAEGRVITPDGKQLPIEEVWKRTKVNAVVAVSSDGGTPNQAFLRALNAEVLVIISSKGPARPPMTVPTPPVPKKEQ